MLCAVYSSPQETSKHSILWSDDGKTKNRKGAHTLWQLRKVERSPQRKRVVQRRRAPRRPPRRDSSNQQGTATFHWRTSTSEASKAFQEERRISSEARRSFCFVSDLISDRSVTSLASSSASTLLGEKVRRAFDCPPLTAYWFL